MVLKLKNLYKENKRQPEDRKLYPVWIIFKDLTQCATGLVFSIVYGFNDKLFDEIKACLCCQKSEPENGDPNGSLVLDDPNSNAGKTDSIHLEL